MSVIDEQALRDYMELNSPGSTSKYSSATLGSNIRAAQGMLERWTSRRFEDQTATLTFSTNGRAYMPIPGLRSASSATLQGTTLTADSTYYLIPDTQQTGVYTGIQFRAFRTSGTNGPWWLSNPEWFDRNLDSPFYPANRGGASTLPNDLTIAGSWGWTDALMPEPVRHTVKVLAEYLTLRPDAILTGGIARPGGDVTDMSNFPIEVQSFVADWKVGSMIQSAN
jgi:hypothetical protein